MAFVPDRVRSETIEIFEAIEARIDREQAILLPKLEESGVFAASAV